MMFERIFHFLPKHIKSTRKFQNLLFQILPYLPLDRLSYIKVRFITYNLYSLISYLKDIKDIIFFYLIKYITQLF